jgi:hypothetical protein
MKEVVAEAVERYGFSRRKVWGFIKELRRSR